MPHHMHTVFTWFCFVMIWHWLINAYYLGLLHWQSFLNVSEVTLVNRVKLTTLLDDVMTWKHFLRHWPFVCVVTDGFPHKGPATIDVYFDVLMFIWTYGWTDNCWWFEMPCSHCDVNVMTRCHYQDKTNQHKTACILMGYKKLHLHNAIVKFQYFSTQITPQIWRCIEMMLCWSNILCNYMIVPFP